MRTAALTPAFDETAVLSLDDIENMLGLSGSTRNTERASDASAELSSSRRASGHHTTPPAAEECTDSATGKPQTKRLMGSIFGGENSPLNDTVSEGNGNGGGGRGRVRGGTACSLTFDDDGSSNEAVAPLLNPRWEEAMCDTVIPEGLAFGRIFAPV
jgi:hypothetical protein